jgi:hypothetical protein
MIGQTFVPLAALVTTLHFGAPPPAPQDGSLMAWHGCWRAVGESAPLGELLCIVPGADASEVRMQTFVDGVPGAATTLRVDGVARPVDEGGCTGTRVARWSADGRRIFLRTDLDCAGMPRTSTGIIGMISEREWVDAQSSAVGPQSAARVLRYRATGAADVPAELRAQLPAGRDLLSEAGRLHAAAELQLDDVVEAARVVAAPALQGFLAERGQPFAMNGNALLRLEQAGVAREIVEILVALSYPKYFAIERPSAAPAITAPLARGYEREVECWDPVFRMVRYGAECDRIDPLLRRYSPYGYYPYGYSRYSSRYGYSPWGYDPYGWHYNTPVVIVVRDDDRPGRVPGAFVKGAGYTRGSGDSGATAQPRSRQNSNGGADRGSAAASPTAGSSGSTGSSSSTQPASSGASSSSGSTGRTAVPRTGGGGGQ